jgi:hypothetical protein
MQEGHIFHYAWFCQPLLLSCCRRDIFCMGWAAATAAYIAVAARLGLLPGSLLFPGAALNPWGRAFLALVFHGIWRPLVTQVWGTGWSARAGMQPISHALHMTPQGMDRPLQCTDRGCPVHVTCVTVDRAPSIFPLSL